MIGATIADWIFSCAAPVIGVLLPVFTVFIDALSSLFKVTFPGNKVNWLVLLIKVELLKKPTCELGVHITEGFNEKLM